MEAAQQALAFVDQSAGQLLDVDRFLALAAARLKAVTGIGYAHSFVATSAQLLGSTAVTDDLDFRQTEGDVAVEWLPEVALNYLALSICAPRGADWLLERGPKANEVEALESVGFRAYACRPDPASLQEDITGRCDVARWRCRPKKTWQRQLRV